MLGAHDALHSARARDTAVKRADKHLDLYRASPDQLRMCLVGSDGARF